MSGAPITLNRFMVHFNLRYVDRIVCCNTEHYLHHCNSYNVHMHNNTNNIISQYLPIYRLLINSLSLCYKYGDTASRVFHFKNKSDVD